MTGHSKGEASPEAPKLVQLSRDTPKSWQDSSLERVPRERAEKRQGQNYVLKDISKVYLEDVEAIVYLIAKHTQTISMQTEEFIIVDPKQLRDVPQERIAEFIIEARNPQITVDIGERRTRITTYSDAPEVQELAEDIRAILLRRVSRLLPKVRKSPILVAALLAIVWLAATRQLGISGSRQILGFYAVMAGSFVYWAILSHILSLSRGVLTPHYKKENSPPWFVSDQFKIALVTAVITSIVTAVFTAIATALIVGNEH